MQRYQSYLKQHSKLIFLSHILITKTGQFSESLINIIREMKRNQSILQSWISGCYFAVQPLSIFFRRDYSSGFNLYFQKGLQIIFKNQIRSSGPRKDEVIAFSAPALVPYFRIQSDKNLEYEWSLYVSQQQGDQHQQFVQGQKVSLKPAWQQYLQSKVNVWEGQMEFNAIKCKLTFVVAIARSADELQTIIRQHLQLLNQPIASLARQEEKTSTKVIQVEEQVRQVGSIKQVNKIDTPKKESAIDFAAPPQGDLKQSKILNQFSSPQRQSEKRVSVARESQHPLSLSELQIAEVVGKEVEEYQSKVNEQKVEAVIEITQIPEEHQLENVEAKDESKQIRMTGSQLLDDKREAITPPEQPKTNRTKLIVLAILFVLILTGVGYYTLRAKPLQTKNAAKEKKVQSAKSAKPAKGVKQGKAKVEKREGRK